MSSSKSSSLLIVIVLLLADLSQVHGWRNFVIYLDRCNCTANPTYAARSLCKIDKNSSPPKGNFELKLHHVLRRVRIDLEIFAIRNKNETFTIFNVTDLDACAVLSSNGTYGQNMIQIARKVMLNTGKLPKKCPIDKDFHFVFKDFVLDAEHFPPFVPQTSFGVRSTFREGNQYFFFIECYGEIVHKSKKQWGTISL